MTLKKKLIASAALLAGIAILLVVRAALSESPLERLQQIETPNIAGGETFRGSWHFPRGGPYVLGSQCNKNCVLKVDGRQLTKGNGLKLKRVVFDAGVYDVEFSRASKGRLMWHPPGRRGPAEYVFASSLSPLPAQEASFGSGAGASRTDGAIAVLILALIVAIVCVLLVGVFPLAPGGQRSAWLEVAAVFAIALATRLIGLGEAGQTWDEDTNWSAGKNYVVNLLNFDYDVGSWLWNLEHPPLMKYIAGIGALFGDGYGPARALSAAMMAIACALLVPIASRLGLARAGLYAGIVAALSPHLVGHGQIVGHESAMALTWMLALCGAVCVWPCGEDSKLEVRLAVVGAAVGLAIAARFVNGLVGPLVYLVIVLRAPAQRRIETAWKAALLMPLAAVAVFVLLWPRMWTAPVANLAEAWSVLKKPHMPEPFLGSVTNMPSRFYFVIYLVVTAPLGLLAFAAGGFGWLAKRKWKVALIAALWLLIPMVVSFSPVRQDGVRYIIPSLFALAFVAGVGAHALGERLATISRHARRAPALILCLYLAISCVMIRPYFIDYYGEHVGGASRVAEKRSFEVGWWGEGLAEALDYLNSRAEPGARVHKRCVAPSHLAWLRGDLWKWEARGAKQADWILHYSPVGRKCSIPTGFELAFEASAAGAPLARVYKRVP